MSILTADSVSIGRSTPRPEARAASPEFLRSLLVLGCLASALVAAGVGDPASLVRADPQLAFLLRGMALIKGAMVLSAAAVVFWRLGHPLPHAMAGAYIFGTSVLAGATLLIWQLSFIPLAALAFHVAAFVMLFAAWRDGGDRFRRSGRAG